jgi:2-polyprenyl-6-hydroxyphenyl methylase/3-demethylubiquinone-9 3-methyltransferase
MEELRFEFGKNWEKFVKGISEKKIEYSVNSLNKLLLDEDVSNKSFLDIGSGSGLFSLAAYKKGFYKIHSFDYDKFSVKSTEYIKNKYAGSFNDWIIEKGDILNNDYVERLDKYDYVYSWGVLHHTGDMYKALDNASKLVKKNGVLIIAIYNTQMQTPIWKKIKKVYVKSPKLIKLLLNYIFTIYFFTGLLLFDLLRFRNPYKRYSEAERGMSFYTDVVDWIGGYPFETAKPEEIFDFFKKRGFVLEKLFTVGGKMGCNEFVFRKIN